MIRFKRFISPAIAIIWVGLCVYMHNEAFTAIGSLVLCIIMGLRLAAYNLNDEDGRKYRLEKRREERRKRKK